MNRLLRMTQYIGVFFIICLGILIGVEVVSRYFFNMPITGSIELSQLFLACVVSFSLVAAAMENAHIIVDVLFIKLRSSTQRILLIITGFAGAILFGILSWQGLKFALRSLNMDESTCLLEVPVYPVKFLFAFACFLTFIVLIGQIIRLFRGQRD